MLLKLLARWDLNIFVSLVWRRKKFFFKKHNVQLQFLILTQTHCVQCSSMAIRPETKAVALCIVFRGFLTFINKLHKLMLDRQFRKSPYIHLPIDSTSKKPVKVVKSWQKRQITTVGVPGMFFPHLLVICSTKTHLNTRSLYYKVLPFYLCAMMKTVSFLSPPLNRREL